MRRTWIVSLALVTALIVQGGCFDAPVASPVNRVTQDTPIWVPQNQNNRADVLFMVDNSFSMDAMQAELQAHFKDFLQVFQDLAATGVYADLHIGVVTSDYGAGHTPGGGCDPSPGGQMGHLQKLGAVAPAGCMPPAGGAPYIDYAFGPGGPSQSNLPPGLDLATTFTCMASVGSGGCGFEHPLESVYAALHDTTSNTGFLRDDAFLTVVFVTNEDDGSAPPATHIYDYPGDPSLGAYDTFRQSRWALACNGALLPYGPSGPLENCVPAPDPLVAQALASFTPPVGLYDLSRYTDYFTLPKTKGGIKSSPDDLILVGITGPSTPVQVVLAENDTGNGRAPNPSYVACPAIGPDCHVALQHACQNTVEPAFFADPAVRLNGVINAARFHQIDSICGDDPNAPPDYTQALQKLADLIAVRIGPGCIPAPLTSLDDPNCVVEDVSNATGAEQVIPRCDQANGKFPCWKVEMKSACQSISPQGVGITIDRNGMPAPPDTTAQVSCATVATAPDGGTP